MKDRNKKTGQLGEEVAAKYLIEKGLVVIKRNFATKFGEIDLICRENNLTVFVEVKTKKGTEFGTPEEMFTKAKRNKVKRMATLYLKGEDVPCRIDMVAVELDGNDQPVRVTHYENAG